MPVSTVYRQDLAANGKGYYGDPCYDSTFGSTHTECEQNTPGSSLAHAVLLAYDISISNDWMMGAGANKYGKCCPLDILNQDPFSCIKMSLLSSLIDHEYWEVYADEKIEDYVVDIVAATREHDENIEYGASPRACIWMILAAKATALLQGRGYVLPEDVKAVVKPVLRHRIILTASQKEE